MKKTRYYILDFAPMCCDYPIEVTEVSEEELIDSLKYNHSVAKEYGDHPEALRKILKELKENEDYETDSINAFGYLKLTNKSPEEWGYEG